MKSLLAAALLIGAVSALPHEAAAKGCIRGAVVGGIAGHIVHHGAMGAIAGCVVGMHDAHKAEAARRNDQYQNRPAR